MIKLRNLSKFYYSKGIIASGLSRINLELDMGEFVVITGESGSGKSTLINVLSGLDTYEEGEMYIDGKETSHYTIEDFENYRKKYIANIFQNFNLISSYTVYQNVELILLVEGKTSADVKDKVKEIIDKVGLSEYTNTKVSKLSGGQKQRVAIARALAKETPIIVADEPTGNLDSESAEIVVKLLSELSKDRLVIVVTHNYDQFEKYATRRIKLNDGKLNEDDKIQEVKVESDLKAIDFGKIKPASKLKLGVRNTFNLISKFLLTLFVFLFLVVSVAGQYTSFRSQNDAMGNLGYNEFFENFSDDRIVVKRADNGPMTDADFEALANVKNVKSVFKDDVVLDTGLNLQGSLFNTYAYPGAASSLKEKDITYGRLPQADDEVVLKTFEWTLPNVDPEKYFEGDHTLAIAENKSYPVKIVGVILKDSNNTVETYLDTIYASDALMANFKDFSVKRVTNIELNVNSKIMPTGEGALELTPNDKVSEGYMYVPEEIDGMFPTGSSKWKQIGIHIKSLYFDENYTLTSLQTYTKNNYKNLLGLTNTFDEAAGKVYINPADYTKMFTKPSYQSSVFIEHTKDAKATGKSIEKLGYKTVVLKDAKQTFGDIAVLNIVRVPFVVVMVVIIFFICFFVIKLILKSRSVYFAILRMLGLDMKNLKQILDIEMLLIVNIAYGIFLGLFYAVKAGLFKVSMLVTMVEYLLPKDLVILYIIVTLMALIISRKFAKAMFKGSAMGAYREGA